MTREYVMNSISALSEEQFSQLIIILQQANIIQEDMGGEKKPKKVLTAKGALNKYANPEMISFEREAFENAVVERYIEKYVKNKNS